MSLSDSQCRAAKPKAKVYKLTDGNGLYLRVIPTGGKYWCLKYRLHGIEKLTSIGVYPEISLAEARKEREKIRETLRKGLNPTFERKQKRLTSAIASSDTFEVLAREWHNKNLGVWDERYAATILYRLEKYAFNDIGAYPVGELELNSDIILALLQKIEKNSPEIARRIMKYISLTFIYAKAIKRAKDDPTRDLHHALKKYKKGHFASISVDELSKFLVDLFNHQARLYRQTFLALRLMFLTFVRTNELIGAKWNEMDFENKMWVIPASRMKMKKEHMVPLSRQAIDILLELKEMNGKRDYVFPSLPRPQKPMSDGTILRILDRMGYRNRMTGHGFRSLALGILQEKLKYSYAVADRQLAHAKNGTRAAYDRAELLTERTEMMQKYADYLDKVYLEALNKDKRNANELPKNMISYNTGNYTFSTFQGNIKFQMQ